MITIDNDNANNDNFCVILNKISKPWQGNTIQYNEIYYYYCSDP